METGNLFAFYFLAVVVIFLLIVCIRKLINIESRIENFKPEYAPKWDLVKTICSAMENLASKVHNVCLDLEKEKSGKTANGIHNVRIEWEEENKDEIELRKYCLNNVPGDIGIKSYIAEADMIYHYITTGETEKRSETSKKEEL